MDISIITKAITVEIDLFNIQPNGSTQSRVLFGGDLFNKIYKQTACKNNSKYKNIEENTQTGGKFQMRNRTISPFRRLA